MRDARAIVEGQQPGYMSGYAQTKPSEQATMDAVHLLDPTWTANRFETMKQFADGTTAGTPGLQITSGRTALMHLREAAEQNQVLSQGQSNIPIIGPALNWATNLGKQDYESAYEKAIGKANDELTRFYLGAPGTETERVGELRGALSGNATPDQRRAALQELGALVTGKVNALQERYHAGAGGMPDYPILEPADQGNADFLSGLGGRTGVGHGQPSGADPQPTRSPQAGQPPVPGAVRGSRGNWLVPDPQRPGKYLQVNQ